jgi:hypothetical protein
MSGIGIIGGWRALRVGAVLAAAVLLLGAASAQARPRYQLGFRFKGSNLGCERFLDPSGPFFVCMEWNLKRPVPNSYGFASNHSWQELFRVRYVRRRHGAADLAHAASTQLQIIMQPVASEEQPGGSGPKPPLGQTLIHGPFGLLAVLGPGTFQDSGTGLKFNGVPPVQPGQTFLVGDFPYTASGGAKPFGFIAAVSDFSARLSQYNPAVGEETKVDKKEPPATPDLDAADVAVSQAIVAENEALNDLSRGDRKSAKKRLYVVEPGRGPESSSELLNKAERELDKAEADGEIGPGRHEAIGLELFTALLKDKDAYDVIRKGKALSKARAFIEDALAKKAEARSKIVAAQQALQSGK